MTKQEMAIDCLLRHGLAEIPTACHPALMEINKLLEERDNLEALCGEMIATLSLEPNQLETIAKLNEVCMKGWRKRYDKS